ncbi:MAG: VWA domain-containing protein [Clostridiaceae bacterium]|nr:VWA domain-containing protein [Clostridiaceae bacterium]
MFLILLPVIILLYLLKQKHQDYPISSIILWHEALKDVEANAPWQKLRSNILMILQLMAMSLLIFSLAKPYILTETDNVSDLIMVIDTSASMQCKDVLPSRFEAAKKEMVKIVENSRPGVRFTVISMGFQTTIEVNKSTDKGRVLDSIRQIKVTNGVANIQEARSILRALVNEADNAEIVVFSDTDHDLAGGNVKFIEVAGQNDNAAVTLLSTSVRNDEILALSTLANYSSEQKTLSLTLYGDERVIDAREIVLGPKEIKDVYWNDIPQDVVLLSCTIETPDDLEADNTARTVVNPHKTRKVLLVTEKNIFLEKALSLIPGIELFKTNTQNINLQEGYNLYIYDGILPEKLPSDGNVMVFNPPHGNKHIEVSEDDLQPGGTWEYDHSLMNNVNDRSFAVSKMRDMVVPEWGEVVLSAGGAPAIIAGQKGSQKIIVVGFDLHQTDIPLRPAFPIMIANFTEWLVPSRTQEIPHLLPFENAAFNVIPEAEEVWVITPSGKKVSVAPPFPVMPYAHTEELGFYTIEQRTNKGTQYDFFAVNFPADESDLSFHEAQIENDMDSLEKNNAPYDVGYNMTWIFALFALVVICLEWWVYNYGN